MITELYTTFLYKPLLNILVFTYNILPGHDIGIAIIVLTIAVRIILVPQMSKTLKSQSQMNELQPKIKELKEKHKGDRVAEGQAIMQLYKESGVNPASSCLPILIQIPLFIALYGVFSKALGPSADLSSLLYPFVSNPGTINPYFLGILDLSKFSWILTLLAGAAQYWQTKMMSPKNKDDMDPTQKAMQTQMLYVLPLLTLFIAYQTNMPGGVLLYWVVNSLFQIAQQYYIVRKKTA